MATYKVQDNGKAQSGLRAGDEVVTGGGTYRITGVNSDGSYQSSRVCDVTTGTYTGAYANSGGTRDIIPSASGISTATTPAPSYSATPSAGNYSAGASSPQPVVQQQAASGSYDLTEYLRQRKAAELETTLAGLKGAYEQSMVGYDAAEAKLPQSYDAARNSAAALNAQEKRAFDERAAANGLSSGTAGQAELARSAAYQGNIADINARQANAQSQLDLERAQLKSQYETALAQAGANGDATLASALYKELIRVQGLTREDEQIQWNRSYQQGRDAVSDLRYDDTAAYARAQDAYSRALSEATAKATMGDTSALYDFYGVEPPVGGGYNTYFNRMMAAGVTTSSGAMDWLISNGAVDVKNIDKAQVFVNGYLSWLREQNTEQQTIDPSLWLYYLWQLRTGGTGTGIGTY